jgi:hypothetical protein
MRTRERGNIWPVLSVVGGAFLVLVIVPLILQRGKSARMATVDPQVTIGDASSTLSSPPFTPLYRWPDSEVPRTAERLRDVTAVGVAAVTYVTEGAIRGRAPHDVGEIVEAIVERQLIPAEWLTNQPGVLQMPHSTVHLRYSPDYVQIEVISVPNDRRDGPGILIRIPDPENPSASARYFESLHLDGIVYPNPFAPIAEIVASGWQPRLFTQTHLPDDQRAQIEYWAQIQARDPAY